MSSHLTEIALPFTSRALFIITEALGVERSWTVITTNELSPDVAADATLSHVTLSITLLVSTSVLLLLHLYTSLGHTHARVVRLLLISAR